MKKLFLPGIAVLCCWLPLGVSSLAASAEPEKTPAAEKPADPRLIRVQVEFIEVSHEQLTGLMFGAKPAVNDTELRQQVAQLVKDGKAKVLETLLCTAMNKQKATTESVEEFIYPTEYEPAEIFPKQPAGGKEKQDPAKDSVPVATGPTPTAFDTRNLGSTLEIEPTADEDGKRIDLRFVPEIVYHVGNETWAEWNDEHGSANIQMPTMYVVRLNTRLTLANGKPLLAGALTPKDDKGMPDPTRKLMVFVKADVLPE